MTRVSDRERNGTRNVSRYLDGGPSGTGFEDSNEERDFFEISDEELERASGACDGGVPTLIGTYCFTCPTTYSPPPEEQNAR